MALLLELGRHLPAPLAGGTPVAVLATSTAQLLGMLLVLLSSAGFLWLSQHKAWPAAHWPSLLSLLVLALTFFVQWIDQHRVLQTPAWLVWPMAWALHGWMLYKNEAQDTGQTQRGYIAHVGQVWLLTLWLADALWFCIDLAKVWHTSWPKLLFTLSLALVLIAIAMLAKHGQRAWPMQRYAPAYGWHAAWPLALLLFGGTLALALLSAGQTEPWPYIPFLNPTDLTLGLSIGALWLWRRTVRNAQGWPEATAWVGHPQALAVLAGLAFVVLNTVWLRTAHHVFGVPWDASALFDSALVQAGYAIVWTVLALGLTIVAQRRAQRAMWLAGAGLLGLVILKLWLIDLSHTAGIERIVAFIAVGVMMLVVGYFAPMPPAKTQEN